MTRRRRAPASPLPQREGVDAVRIRLPGAEGRWATVRDHLVDRLAPSAAEIDAMLLAGAVVTADGSPLAPDAPYLPGLHVWFHRAAAPEVPVPFAPRVVYRDEHIVVADKPHFLATTPRGSHVAQTALARLRHDLAIPALGAAHRLDRLTAGLVLFTVRPEERGAYQRLFADRLVVKEYEAVAPHRPEKDFPRTVSSRIVKDRGVLQAREEPGEPNALTRVELLGHREGLGRYRLLPATGRTHQLRVHMSGLGLALLGDPVYPQVRDEGAPGDFGRPLQLLARALEFRDPVTGDERRFESGRTLAAWTSYETWAAGAP